MSLYNYFKFKFGLLVVAWSFIMYSADAAKPIPNCDTEPIKSRLAL